MNFMNKTWEELEKMAYNLGVQFELDPYFDSKDDLIELIKERQEYPLQEIKVIEGKFHHDAAHGWLKISLKDFKKIRLKESFKITSYSYIDAKNVYLEEDQDALTFQKICEKLGYFIRESEVYDGDSSPIRQKNRFYE